MRLIIGRLHHNSRIVPIGDFARTDVLVSSYQVLGIIWSGEFVFRRFRTVIIRDGRHIINLINLNRECIHISRAGDSRT